MKKFSLIICLIFCFCINAIYSQFSTTDYYEGFILIEATKDKQIGLVRLFTDKNRLGANSPAVQFTYDAANKFKLHEIVYVTVKADMLTVNKIESNQPKLSVKNPNDVAKIPFPLQIHNGFKHDEGSGHKIGHIDTGDGQKMFLAKSGSIKRQTNIPDQDMIYFFPKGPDYELCVREGFVWTALFKDENSPKPIKILIDHLPVDLNKRVVIKLCEEKIKYNSEDYYYVLDFQFCPNTKGPPCNTHFGDFYYFNTKVH